jgi:hypothetical protein
VVVRLALVVAMAGLAGCGTIGQGVTKAIIEKAEEKPAPEASFCEIAGPEYPGIAAGFKDATPANPKTVRLIIVHGIGAQQPGYSEGLQHNLVAALGLATVDPVVKTIQLRTPPDAMTSQANVPVGKLRISRYTNGKGAELLTFELTWADILEAERKAMAFDDYGNAAKVRAEINTSLKKLINSFTDPLAYHGTRGALIRASVMQGLCWAGHSEWSDYPAAATTSCSWRDTKRNVVQRDTFVISTHSLGSRVTLDALAALGTMRESLGNDAKARVAAQALDSLRDKDITFFMMSNQLPLLQMGTAPPAISNKNTDYCGPNASKIKERWFKGLAVVAFSDPNDILSYQIPQSFAGDFMDSRLCAATTNVSISVAKPVSLAVTSFASPEAAHTHYDGDERVLALMTQGLKDPNPVPSCSWLRYQSEAQPAASGRPEG